MTPGTVVGELALLYSTPRAATVIAQQDSTVWKLDGDTFRHVVQKSSMLKRDRQMSSLKKVPLLKSLNESQRTQVADALVPITFCQGDVVVRQGDQGDTFYILG